MTKMSRSLVRLLLAQAGFSLLAVAWVLVGRDFDARPYEPFLLMLPVVLAAAFVLHVPFSLTVFRTFCGLLASAGTPLALLLIVRSLEHFPSPTALLLGAQALVAIAIFRALPRTEDQHLEHR